MNNVPWAAQIRDHIVNLNITLSKSFLNGIRTFNTTQMKNLQDTLR